MIDVIMRHSRTIEYEKWLLMFEDELLEIYTIEGVSMEGIEFEDWVSKFYEAGGTI